MQFGRQPVPAERRISLVNRMLRSLRELEKVSKILCDETCTGRRLNGYSSWYFAYDTVVGDEVGNFMRLWHRNNRWGNEVRRKVVKVCGYLKREGISDLRERAGVFKQAGIPIDVGGEPFWLEKEENEEEGFAGDGYIVLPGGEMDMDEANTVRKRRVPCGERPVLE